MLKIKYYIPAWSDCGRNWLLNAKTGNGLNPFYSYRLAPVSNSICSFSLLGAMNLPVKLPGFCFTKTVVSGYLFLASCYLFKLVGPTLVSKPIDYK